MLLLQDGNPVPMTEALTMSDGTKVLPDGSVTLASGKALMLHNGQAVLPDGRVVDHNKKSKSKRTQVSL